MLVLTLRRFGRSARRASCFIKCRLVRRMCTVRASLSLDRLLSNGMKHSALRSAALAIARRLVQPCDRSAYVLAIRLWLAAALAGPVSSHTMLPAMQAGCCRRGGLLSAVLLALGLGTPVVAAVLFVAGSGMAMAGSGHGIYEPCFWLCSGHREPDVSLDQ